MKTMTRLEEALAKDTEFLRLRNTNAPASEVQRRLDSITMSLCQGISPDILVEHMRVVYDKTANTYSANPEHKHIPDALLTFMSYCSDDDLVLDLGCGFGRDATFMALRDWELRQEFMGRIKDGRSAFERIGLPSRSMCVVGVDSSKSMKLSADRFAQAHGLRTDPRDPPADVVFLDGIDMHNPVSQHWGQFFDGVWSSAALFMHTPRALIRPALEGVAQVLRSGGIFGVSYAHNSTGLPYDNLRYSRTGEIKYFSRPTPQAITIAVDASGFILRKEEYADLEMAGRVQKDFFITQFFQKR